MIHSLDSGTYENRILIARHCPIFMGGKPHISKKILLDFWFWTSSEVGWLTYHFSGPQSMRPTQKWPIKIMVKLSFRLDFSLVSPKWVTAIYYLPQVWIWTELMPVIGLLLNGFGYLKYPIFTDCSYSKFSSSSFMIIHIRIASQFQTLN